MIDNTKEYILCAAVMFPGVILVCDFRHDDCLSTFSRLTNHACHDDTRRPPIKGAKQGFLTSTGRFVDRKIAAQLAYSAGQIRDPIPTLFSEDLY